MSFQCYVSGPGVSDFIVFDLPAVPRVGEMLFVEGSAWAVRVKDVQWQLDAHKNFKVVNVLVARTDERGAR